MITLFDLRQEILRIREAVNSLDIKGRENASLIVYIYDKCDTLIKEVNEVMNSQPTIPDDANSNNDDHENGGETNE